VTKNSMEQTNDQWLWFVDSELVDALARHDTLDSKSEKRPVQSAALVKALALNMEGKTEQALREVRDAIGKGETLLELDWAEAHLEFQVGQYQEALQGYEKILSAQPNHKAAIYNAALCLEKLDRFDEAAKVFPKGLRAGSQAAGGQSWIRGLPAASQSPPKGAGRFRSLRGCQARLRQSAVREGHRFTVPGPGGRSHAVVCEITTRQCGQCGPAH